MDARHFEFPLFNLEAPLHDIPLDDEGRYTLVYRPSTVTFSIRVSSSAGNGEEVASPGLRPVITHCFRYCGPKMNPDWDGGNPDRWILDIICKAVTILRLFNWSGVWTYMYTKDTGEMVVLNVPPPGNTTPYRLQEGNLDSLREFWRGHAGILGEPGLPGSIFWLGRALTAELECIKVLNYVQALEPILVPGSDSIRAAFTNRGKQLIPYFERPQQLLAISEPEQEWPKLISRDLRDACDFRNAAAHGGTLGKLCTRLDGINGKNHGFSHRLLGWTRLIVSATLKHPQILQEGFFEDAKETAMLVLLVNIKVKPECVEDFKRATVDNATNSRKEPGVARFDFCQANDDPTCFILYEAYRMADGHASHRETPHYKRWKAAVETMMAEPRTGLKFTNVYPSDAAW